jgi:hypothetical protein
VHTVPPYPDGQRSQGHRFDSPRRQHEAPDILHAHDWQAAMVVGGSVTAWLLGSLNGLACETGRAPGRRSCGCGEPRCDLQPCAARRLKPFPTLSRPSSTAASCIAWLQQRHRSSQTSSYRRRRPRRRPS